MFVVVLEGLPVAHLFFRDVADLENTGLFDLDQEHGFFPDLGLDSRGDSDFVDALRNRVGLHAKLDIDRRLFLLQQDGGRIGLFQRRLLEIDALDLENWCEVVGHASTFRLKRAPNALRDRRCQRQRASSEAGLSQVAIEPPGSVGAQ